jgi:hypothetical protein
VDAVSEVLNEGSTKMTESDSYESPLNQYQVDLLNRTRALKPTEPPEPWGNKVIVAAGGVLAAGWDKAENFLLISVEGYSLTDPASGVRLLRNRDREKTFASILPGNLQFRMVETQEIISIFGVNGGDGIHHTEDGWTLAYVYPWWPEEAVLIKLPFVPGSGRYHLLDDAYLIKLERIDGWLKCGFSPSGKHFAIVGSAGAEIFSR